MDSWKLNHTSLLWVSVFIQCLSWEVELRCKRRRNGGKRSRSERGNSSSSSLLDSEFSSLFCLVAAKMPVYHIRGVEVHFPHPAYDCQLVYMERVIESLQEVCSQYVHTHTHTHTLTHTERERGERKKKREREPSASSLQSMMKECVLLAFLDVLLLSSNLAKWLPCISHQHWFEPILRGKMRSLKAQLVQERLSHCYVPLWHGKSIKKRFLSRWPVQHKCTHTHTHTHTHSLSLSLTSTPSFVHWEHFQLP